MPFFSIRPSNILGLREHGRTPFLYRQIVTTGYVAAGYKDSVAWRNVNVNNHATDVCTNLGDLLQESGSYLSGAHNKNKAFVWGTNGTGSQGMGNFANTSCFNMRNNTTATKTSAMNLAYAVGDSGTLSEQTVDGEYTYSWQNGGQGVATLQKFNLIVEIHQSTQSTSLTNTGTASAHQGERHGYFWEDSADTATLGRRKFVFQTETESATASSMSAHGQQKGLSSKVGFGYAGNEGTYNGGNNFRKWNYTTEVVQSTMTKVFTDQGEENYLLGQDRGYMLGAYGAPGPVQHNRSLKWTYATDSGVELGAAGQPSGTSSGTGASGAAIGGRSSGHGFWRD